MTWQRECELIEIACHVYFFLEKNFIKTMSAASTVLLYDIIFFCYFGNFLDTFYNSLMKMQQARGSE